MSNEKFRVKFGLQVGDNAANIDTSGNIVAGGNLTVSGNQIKSSTTNTAITLNDTSVTIAGNLTVQGTTTTVNSETVNIADNLITLNSNVTGTPTEDAGIEIERGGDPNVSIQWYEVGDRWRTTVDGSTWINLPNQALDTTSDVQFDDLKLTGSIKDSTNTAVASFSPSSGGAPGLVDFNSSTNGYGINVSYVAIDDGTAALNTERYTATTTTANQVLDSLSSSIYRSVKYLIQMSHASAGYELVECLVMHNGSASYIMTYGDLRSGSGIPFVPLATFDTDLSGGNMRLLVTPANANTSFAVMKTVMKI